MFKKILLAWIISSLWGCASPSFNSEVVSIEADDLDKYWKYSDSEITSTKLIGTTGGCYRVLPKRLLGKFNAKSMLEVNVSLVIDSNGKSFEHKLLKGTSNEAVNTLTTGLVKRIKFSPSESNISRTPVRITETVALFEDPRPCRPFANAQTLLASERAAIWTEERL